MNEVKLDTLRRSAGVDQTLNSGQAKKAAHPAAVDDRDTSQFSAIPYLTGSEQSVEAEYAARRASLAGAAASPNYPSADVLGNLASIFASSSTFTGGGSSK